MTLDTRVGSSSPTISWRMRQNQRKLASLEQQKANYTRAHGMLVAKRQSAKASSPKSVHNRSKKKIITANSPTQAASQLNPSLVPNNDSLSTFIEAGQHGKDTGSHLNHDLTPEEKYDAGIGFEGWYGNGQNDYQGDMSHFGRDRKSSICGSNWAPNEEAEVFVSGWYDGGKIFGVPAINPGMRKLGSNLCINESKTKHHLHSSVSFNDYGTAKIDDIPSNPYSPTRIRSVSRKSLSIDTASPYDTSYTEMSSPLVDHKHVRVTRHEASPKGNNLNFCRSPEKQISKPDAPPWFKVQNGMVLASDYE